MIKYALRCEVDHEFEAWFASSAAYDAQVAAGQIFCPECNSCEVGKSIMAPNITPRTRGDVPIPEGEWATLGGYVFARLGRIPQVGDRVTFPGGEAEVVAMDGRRVAGVRILRARKAES